MSEKITIREKMQQLLSRQELVVKIDVVIFLSYFVEKVLLNFIVRDVKEMILQIVLKV